MHLARRLLPLLALSALAVTAPVVTAQDPFEKDESALNSRAAKRLLTFARNAERLKVFSRAKEAYDLILNEYEPTNATARKALGFKKKGKDWIEPDVPRRWPDDSDDERRWKVIDEWRRIADGIGKIHRELGLKMLEPSPLRGVHHLERAIWFNPFDVDAHKALEHVEHDGFWGTEADVAFVKRMRELEKEAVRLAKKEYSIEPVTTLPPQLQRMTDEDADIEFHGAKSDTITIFCRGTQKAADDCVLWAERAIDFVAFALPEGVTTPERIRKSIKRGWNWMGYVWTDAEKKAFIRLNPELNASNDYVNVLWAENGKRCDVSARLTPASMHDAIISRICYTLLGGGNDCLVEGTVHAITWYMKATCYTRRGGDDSGTSTGKRVVLPPAANWWLREVREQARSASDWPSNQLPRVQLSKFHNDARLKSWSFMTFMLARYPEKWLKFVSMFPDPEKVPFPEHVDAKAEEILETSLAAVEEVWRNWASGRSGAASATGYGPPLVQRKPNSEEIAGLQRVNEFRRIAGLPLSELDQETTASCRAHALYLSQYPEEWIWPNAHEEDPSKDGFSRRGMQAGQNSVIMIVTPASRTPDTADSVDGWIGTVYHRFPLLRRTVKRIGLSVENNIALIDQGSMEEPTVIDMNAKTNSRDAFLAWPVDGMVNIPLAFHADEHPDPLDDSPEDDDPEDWTAQRKSGYPISLQLEPHVAQQLDDASIAVFECKKKGRKYEASDVVACYVHTPKVPLLKRMEDTSVVFAIPKAHLKSNTVYEVLVTLRFLAGEDEVKWRFKTGTKKTGHGRLKIDEKVKFEGSAR